MCNQIKAHVCFKLRGWSRTHSLANKRSDMHSVTHWSQPQLPTHTSKVSPLTTHPLTRYFHPEISTHGIETHRSWGAQGYKGTYYPWIFSVGLSQPWFPPSIPKSHSFFSFSSTETSINHADFRLLSDRGKNMAQKPSLLYHPTKRSLSGLFNPLTSLFPLTYSLAKLKCLPEM